MKYPIDYCIIALNEVRPFVKLQFESLVKENPSFNILGNESFDSFNSFHIVDKRTKDGVVEYCKERIPSVKIHPLDYYSVQNRLGNYIGSDWQWDLAYSIHYAIENCGDSEWILLNHPDIVYWNPKEFFKGLWGMAQSDVGNIWDGGMALIRREAFMLSHLGFWPLFGTVYYLDRGNHFLANQFDERLNHHFVEKADVISGLEAGELFRMELPMLGWKSLVIPYEISRHKEHTAGSTQHEVNSTDPLWVSKMLLVNARLEAYGG